MQRSVLDEPRFRNEQAAYAYVESIVWPNGRGCPHCGVVDNSQLLKGKSTRIGVYKCYACRKPFTVKVGTIFEKSHVPLHIWLQAMHLLCSSKKGFSANQFCRLLGVDFKTGWFIGHRIREAMGESGPGPLGGEGKTVEVDETFYGWIDPAKKWVDHPYRGRTLDSGSANRMKIVTLVERGGKARSIKAEDLRADTLRRIVMENADRASRLMTDERPAYRHIGDRFAGGHETVNHGEEEWVRGEAHVNTTEGFFAVFKRGMRGTYQHCSERHLHRYLAEFDFRYNNRTAISVNDIARTEQAIRGIIGKRLTYRTTRGEATEAGTT
jgi:transposase-like protein